jgi:hypothetical protein
MKINNITQNIYSDEWHTDAKTAALAIRLLDPPLNSSIMLPFDQHMSEFRIQLQAAGHKVIYGVRDWLESEYQYDLLITNPPFSLKDFVIEKVLTDGKRATLILPLDSLGGVKRHQLFQKWGYPHVYIPTRRIAYFDEFGVKRKGASFHSVILTFNSAEQGQMSWECLA